MCPSWLFTEDRHNDRRTCTRQNTHSPMLWPIRYRMLLSCCKAQCTHCFMDWLHPANEAMPPYGCSSEYVSVCWGERKLTLLQRRLAVPYIAHRSTQNQLSNSQFSFGGPSIRFPFLSAEFDATLAGVDSIQRHKGRVNSAQGGHCHTSVRSWL